MTAAIPGGSVLWARTVFQSPIWGKSPQVFKAFFWIVGHAAFEDGHTFKGHVLMRGQLVTTYTAIADAMAYCFNRAIIKPSVKEVRVILLWLQSEGMITVKPLIDGTSANKGRPTDLTRAYVGLLISVVNYDTYQDYKSYKGRDKGRPSLEQGQLRERMEKEYIKTFLSNSDEIRLADLLLEKIVSRSPNFKKPNIQAWAKDIDLMIRIDKRDVSEIGQVIEWCQQDQFWQSNILSTSKLRKQYDQLFAKMKSTGAVKEYRKPESLEAIRCQRCGQRIIVKSDLTENGCVYCEGNHERNGAAI